MMSGPARAATAAATIAERIASSGTSSSRWRRIDARRPCCRKRSDGNASRSAFRCTRTWITIGPAIARSPIHAAGFSQITTGSALAGQQEVAQAVCRGSVGDDQRILKTFGASPAPASFEEGSDRVGVLAARQAGIHRNGSTGFQVRELEVAPVRKLDLFAAHHLKQHHLVTHARRACELVERRVFLVVEI